MRTRSKCPAHTTERIPGCARFLQIFYLTKAITKEVEVDKEDYQKLQVLTIQRQTGSATTTEFWSWFLHKFCGGDKWDSVCAFLFLCEIKCQARIRGARGAEDAAEFLTLIQHNLNKWVNRKWRLQIYTRSFTFLLTKWISISPSSRSNTDTEMARLNYMEGFTCIRMFNWI